MSETINDKGWSAFAFLVDAAKPYSRYTTDRPIWVGGRLYATDGGILVMADWPASWIDEVRDRVRVPALGDRGVFPDFRALLDGLDSDEYDEFVDIPEDCSRRIVNVRREGRPRHVDAKYLRLLKRHGVTQLRLKPACHDESAEPSFFDLGEVAGLVCGMGYGPRRDWKDVGPAAPYAAQGEDVEAQR